MQLSRGWWKQLFRWAAAMCLCAAATCLCVASGGILRIVDPVSRENAIVVKRYPLSPGVQLASIDPANAFAEGADSEAIADSSQSTAPSALVGPTSTPHTSAEGWGRGEAQRDIPQATSRPERSVNLRIARDSERCPKVICYKWHLVTQRLKLPHYTKVELAGLRLPPSLRRGLPPSPRLRLRPRSRLPLQPRSKRRPSSRRKVASSRS